MVSVGVLDGVPDGAACTGCGVGPLVGGGVMVPCCTRVSVVYGVGRSVATGLGVVDGLGLGSFREGGEVWLRNRAGAGCAVGPNGAA